MNSSTSPKARKALAEYKQSRDVDGYATVRDAIWRTDTGWMLIVDVAHEGTRSIHFSTLREIHEKAQEWAANE